MAVEPCVDLVEGITEKPIIGKRTAHELLVLLAIVSISITLMLSFGQILCHATHYHIPEQQRRINRLLLMVPIYGVSNMLAAIKFKHSVYYELVGNAYAAIGLASFFNLLYAYVTEGAEDPKLYFRNMRPRRWQWPLSWPRRGRRGGLYALRTPRSGLTWFSICYCGVFQYNFLLIATCIAGCVASAFGRYCTASLSPTYAYVWVLTVNTVSALVSGYCLTQFHFQVRKDVYKHRADFQFLCIDIVLYLSTFQKLDISILARFRVIKAGPHLQESDIRVVLPATCLCVEMAFVALLHIFAYPYAPYKVWRRPKALENHVISKTRTYTGKGIALVALVEMLNFVDLIEGIWRAFKYLLYDLRHRHHEIGYADNHIQEQARRTSVWGRASGTSMVRSRVEKQIPSVDAYKEPEPVEDPPSIATKQ